MKKILILTSIAACLLSSCLKDDGNYSYTKIQPVEITGLQDSYRFILQKDITLSPVVKTEINQNDIEYIWRIGNDTLAHTKDFKYKFTKVPVSSDPLTFEIYNKKTDVRYPKTMALTVVSPFTTGWMMLTAEGNLAFQSFEDVKELYQDAYSTVNGKKLEGTPVCVSQMNFQDGVSGQYMDRVSVIMKDGKCALLDGNSMSTLVNYYDLFKGLSTTPNIAFENGYWYGYFGGTVFVITEDGEAYGKVSGSMSYPEDLYFEFPYEGDSKGYKLAPHMTGAYYANYYVGFDELNKRFVYLTPSSLSSTIKEVSAIDASDLGECVWMGGNYNSNVFSIHENNGEYTVATFGMDWSANPSGYAKATLPSGTLDASSCYAVQSNGAYIFASKGKKLLAINVAGLAVDPSTAVTELCEYEGDITAMSMDVRAGQFVSGYINRSEFGLTIQTSPTTSSLLIVNQDLSTHGQIDERYDGIQGKVISLSRKTN